MAVRTNVPQWMENQNRWQIKVSKDGERKTFYSKKKGREGKIACQQKADKWLGGLKHQDKKVNALLDAFLEDQQARTSTGNYINMESLTRIWLRPAFGFKRISDLTEQDMQNVLNKAKNEGRAYKTIMNIRGAITAFLRFARKCKVTDLRADDLIIPNKAKKGERRVLQESDLNILFTTATTRRYEEVTEEWYIHAYRFYAVTGMRPGELCELKRENASDGTITVDGNFNRFGEHTEGKTDNAIRTFVLPDVAVKILNDQLNMLKKAGIISKYIFPRPDGSQTTSRTLYKHWKKYQSANGLPGISLYELRHTFVSVCKKKLPEELIKPIIGHSSAMPSYNTYGHTMDGDLDLAASIVNDLYSDILKS